MGAFLVVVGASAVSAATPEGHDQAIARQIALDYMQQAWASLGLNQTDVAEVVVANQQISRHTGTAHLYLQQMHGGIPVYNGLLSLAVSRRGEVSHVGNRFVPDLGRSIMPGKRVMTAVEAVGLAANALGLGTPLDLRMVALERGSERRTRLSGGGISRAEIPARLVYQPLPEGGLRLAWDLTIEAHPPNSWWGVRIDAESGEVLDQNRLVAHERYLVYPMPIENPNQTTPIPPADARTIQEDPYLMGSGSPWGWHDMDGVAGPEFTVTRGNNVHARADYSEVDVPPTDGGSGLDFTGALVPLDLSSFSLSNAPAAVTNLFYWNNICHDVFYAYGFDEAAGNFQFNNYGKGGVGGDEVEAIAHFESAECNAFFGTPADGSRPRMEVGYCGLSASTRRDGAFDHSLVVHEYGHGVSNRLTGGAANIGCLNNSEQMGEGWSDYLGMMLTMEASALGSDARGMLAYLLGQPADGPGIRPAPYSTDFGVNNFTYKNISELEIPHGVGFVWATMLWDMTWDLIDAYEFNLDIYGDWTTGGNNLALQSVIDGLKLQPCSPGFVDGRDAILAADDLLTGDGTSFSGVNQCTIWRAFANRGLGVSTSQGNPDSISDGHQAFDLPAPCTVLEAVPDSIDLCAGEPALSQIRLSDLFIPPVDLSVSGAPAGISTSFTPNPVAGPLPNVSELTLGNTAGIPAGNYRITVLGEDGGNTFSTPLDLNVFTTAPAAPALIAPADTAIDEVVLPTFEWQAVAGALSYTLEVDDDAAFGSLDYTASGIEGTTHTATIELDRAKRYYWRVRANNPCGEGPDPTPSRFTTGIPPGECPPGVLQILHFMDDLEDATFDDPEDGTVGWTSSGLGNTWSLSSAQRVSGLWGFHAQDPNNFSDQRLISPPIALPADAEGLTLQFQNFQAFEAPYFDGRCWDAGVLEISTDGGSTWNYVPASAMLSDPYDSTILPFNPMFDDYGAAMAWCAEWEPFLLSVVDLSAYSGTVRFAWRLGSSALIGNEGWFLDDVSVRSCFDPGPPIFTDGFESGSTSIWSATVP